MRNGSDGLATVDSEIVVAKSYVDAWVIFHFKLTSVPERRANICNWSPHTHTHNRKYFSSLSSHRSYQLSSLLGERVPLLFSETLALSGAPTVCFLKVTMAICADTKTWRVKIFCSSRNECFLASFFRDLGHETLNI